MKNNLLLHGSYFNDNFGDYLLCKIIVDIIHEQRPEISIHIPIASNFFLKNLKIKRTNYISDLLTSSAVIFGGGGYFGEPNRNRHYWNFQLMKNHISVGKVIKLRNIPYAIFGIGAGPLTNTLNRKMVVDICNGAEILTVRDEESKDYLLDYGVKKEIIVTTDLALSITKDFIPNLYKEQANNLLKKYSNRRLIAVHPSCNTSDPQDPIFKNIKLLVNDIIHYSQDNEDIFLVLISDESSERQLEIANQINKCLPQQSLILPYGDPMLLTAVLSLVDIVISSKLHIGIVASALGKMVLSFPFHNKVKRFYNQIDANDRCIPLAELKEKQAYYMLNEYSLKSFTIPELLKKSSENNKQLLRTFLDNIVI